jgi:hypothetical protein|tara:strand:+ start:187 stop:708 length:522 start_codon:yes stop_codon:yes gene_type:complete
MGTLNTTASIKSDIIFQQIDTQTNSVDNRQGSLGQTFTLASGTGNGEINAVYNVQDTTLSGLGSVLEIDFSAATQPIVLSSFGIQFTRVNGLAVYNKETTVDKSIFVRATGSDSFQEPFNGQSGNYKINPEGSYMYSDKLVGATVDSSNKNFQIVNNHSGTTTFTIIAVGVSG